jgi:phosphate transport system substrate-binding protein
MKINKLIATAGAAAVLTVGAVAFNTFGVVTIKGSDTLLILNQRWAEVYGQTHAGTAVNVTGGGSSIGIKAFTNGVTDIAASSRPMKKSEIDGARSRGSIANEIPVALDGLAVVVNSSNGVKSLSMEQLRRIYVGQVTNWSQVGGANLPVVVFSRDSNSGTYGFFQANVLKNQNWGKGVRFMPSTSEEAREVARTPGGIAYGGVAYFSGNAKLKILPISPKDGEAPIAPTEANVKTKKYPIWRYLYYYTNGKPKGDTKAFIDFCLSAEGQKIVEEVGYYSLK